MSRPKSTIPRYTLHKPSGQGCVYIDRKRHYLGKYGSPESLRRYSELIANGSASVPGDAETAPQAAVTVAEVLLKFATEKLPRYVTSDGKPSAEQDCFAGVIRILRDLFGETPAAEFGPLKMRTCRSVMIDRGWSRGHINKQMGRLRFIFKFAAGWELIPGSVCENLRTVEPLRPGDSKAPETKRRQAVPLEHIAAAKRHLRQRNRDLVDLLLLTGARPAEILGLTTAMIQSRTERDGVWVVVLEKHKTARYGHDRKLYFNASAQEILARYLNVNRPADRLFPVQRKTFGTAVRDACIAAGVPAFTPHWLRHTAGTAIADVSGAETAQRVLGHATLAMTGRYSTAAEKQAVEGVKKLG